MGAVCFLNQKMFAQKIRQDRNTNKQANKHTHRQAEQKNKQTSKQRESSQQARRSTTRRIGLFIFRYTLICMQQWLGRV